MSGRNFNIYSAESEKDFSARLVSKCYFSSCYIYSLYALCEKKNYVNRQLTTELVIKSEIFRKQGEKSHTEFLLRLFVNRSRDTCCKFDQCRQFRFDFITAHSFRFRIVRGTLIHSLDCFKTSAVNRYSGASINKKKEKTKHIHSITIYGLICSCMSISLLSHALTHRRMTVFCFLSSPREMCTLLCTKIFLVCTQFNFSRCSERKDTNRINSRSALISK